MMVHTLKIDGMLVFFLDFMRRDILEYFKFSFAFYHNRGAAYFANPNEFFNYTVLLNPAWHKSKLLTPEEDVDFEGHKGYFTAKGKDFRICILCTIQPDQVVDPE